MVSSSSQSFVLLLVTDTDLSSPWARWIGNTGEQSVAYSVVPMADCGAAITGQTGERLFLSRRDSNG
jgi:hypothetical protein